LFAKPAEAGPDHQYDPSNDNILQVGKLKYHRPRDMSAFLMNEPYDPTNGTVSRGDIWRIKQ